MLISWMLPWSLFGVGLAPYERLMWFAYGHLEREQRLNQRALVAWCQDPHSFSRWVQAMQTPSLLLRTSGGTGAMVSACRHAPVTAST